MEHGHGGGDYKDLVVFLAAAGVIVPLFNRWKISPVLGFLAAGVLLGPFGLARFADQLTWLNWLTISNRDQIGQLAELGVAFLLFMIGLELSWERLKAMRRLIFGLGLLQVALSTLALAVLFIILGQPFAGAVVLGMGLALSSTAVVMPVMAERGRLRGATGRSTFAILLAQDLAVAPLLITVTVLAGMATAGAAPVLQEINSLEQGGEAVIAVLDPAVIGRGLLTLAPAALGLAAIVLMGRLVIRPMFRSAARARGGKELFVAAALLLVVGAGAAAQAAGLSMSLGALVAGLLLAETEYRREVEVSIEPFKGLLLGVFFVGVGIGLDLDILAAEPVRVLGLAGALIAIKAAIIFGLARMFGVGVRPALETAMVLGPAGEFAFVILNAGMVEGLADPEYAQGVLVAATISMFSVPLFAFLGERLARRVPGAKAPAVPEEALADPAEAEVLIVGFGRVGRLVGEMLAEHGKSFIAIDSDSAVVTAGRRDGHRIYFGDAGRPEMLHRCGIDSLKALVVTMDAPGKVDEVVMAARAARDDLVLIARARDDRHAARLYSLGATDAVPETTEASLQLAENTLVDLGVPMDLVLSSIHERRDVFRRLFQAAVPEDRRSRPTRALRASSPKDGR